MRSGISRPTVYKYIESKPWLLGQMVSAITDVLGLVPSASHRDGGSLTVTFPRGLARALAALAFAHGWELLETDSPSDARLRPARP